MGDYVGKDENSLRELVSQTVAISFISGVQISLNRREDVCFILREHHFLSLCMDSPEGFFLKYKSRTGNVAYITLTFNIVLVK